MNAIMILVTTSIFLLILLVAATIVLVTAHTYKNDYLAKAIGSLIIFGFGIVIGITCAEVWILYVEGAWLI